LQAGGGNGHTLVDFVTNIFEILAAACHPEMHFVLCLIVVHCNIGVTTADTGLLNRRLGVYIFKKAGVVMVCYFRADEHSWR